MKKALLALVAVTLLAGCVGYVDQKDAKGRTTHDLYVLHPAITISGYTSGL